MKNILWISLLALGAWSFARAQPSVSFDVFYSSLSPMGEWIPMDGGTYAWRPVGVAGDWRPYSDGQWIWTDDGWYWQSDEPWGWATYHYGRWYYDDYYGWVWVPGYDWAPAWVEWRYGGPYVGWAPLSPYAVFSVSWGIHYRRYWNTPYIYWNFVDCRYMGQAKIGRYIYRSADNIRFIGRTRTGGSVRYDNGRILTRGPEREFVERHGNIRLNRVDIVDVRERGQAGIIRTDGRERIGVYRPAIRPDGNFQGPERPERLRTDVRRIGLDIRGTDIQRRATDAAEGRDMRRADEMRRVEPAPRMLNERPPAAQPGSRQSAPAVRPDRSPGRQRVEMNRPSAPKPAPQERAPRVDRPSRERQAPTPQVRRESPRPTRESAPPRRESPSRGGGEKRGGRR
jgi:hypothetical protein